MGRKLWRWISAGMAALIALMATALIGCKAVKNDPQEQPQQETVPAGEQTQQGAAPTQEATEDTQPQTESGETVEVTTEEAVTEESTTSTTEYDDAYWETIDIEDIPNPSIPDMTDLG